ncbi:MAG: DUF2065 domain-containing protein [Desulfovibrionaceae bacterium]|nr:DUF2065 domain-containing protein [Desulfovibrionaceae bacterium]MDD4951653.1 DUF2065 domain-containing protein [Desulfovibrionaceae bacterium]
MNINWSILLIGLGLAFVIEGLPYFLFAEKMPRVLSKLVRQPAKSLRILGFTAIVLGVLLVFFGRSL